MIAHILGPMIGAALGVFVAAYITPRDLGEIVADIYDYTIGGGWRGKRTPDELDAEIIRLRAEIEELIARGNDPRTRRA